MIVESGTLMNFHEPLEIKCNFQRPSSSDSPLGGILIKSTNSVITSPKGFSASKCDVGNRIFSKSKAFFEKMLGKFLDFVGEFFGGFFGRMFWGGFFGRIFWEEFFGRNSYIVKVR